MKIYVVTNGEYSDYHICCVVDNKELAEELAKRYSGRYDTAIVEKYDTDDYNHEALRYKGIYDVRINPDSSVESVNLTNLDWCGGDNINRWDDGTFFVTTYADDEDGAIKSAMDKRAKWLAEKTGL